MTGQSGRCDTLACCEKTILTPEDIAAIESIIAKGDKALTVPLQHGGVKVLRDRVEKVYERKEKLYE